MSSHWWNRFWPRKTLPRATVFTRTGCGLCDEAVALLKEEGYEVELVDIETDQGLIDRYGNVIPVVEIDGKERFRGRVNRVLLRRLN